MAFCAFRWGSCRILSSGRGSVRLGFLFSRNLFTISIGKGFEEEIEFCSVVVLWVKF